MWDAKMSRRSLLATAAAAPVAGGVVGGLTSGPAAQAAITLFEDLGTSIQAAGWTITQSSTAGSYITDSTQSQGNPYGIDMKSTPAGTYLFYADRVSDANQTYAEIRKDFGTMSGAWDVVLLMRITKLPKVHSRDPLRGLGIVIGTGTTRFHFALIDTRLLALVDDGGNDYIERWVDMPIDGTFHYWTFRFDGTNRIVVLLDGLKIAHFQNTGIASASPVGRLALRVSAGDWAADWAEIQMDRIRVTLLENTVQPTWPDTDIAGMTVLPTSSASSMTLIANLHNVDPAQISAGAISVTATVSKGSLSVSNTGLATSTNGGAVPITLAPPSGMVGEVSVQLRAHADTGAPGNGQILGQLTQKWTLPSAVHTVPHGGSATSSPSVSHLFTAMDEISVSGWNLGSYTYKGTSTSGTFLRTTSTAAEFTVPVSLSGWFAVYIGYLSGTQGFSVRVGSTTTQVQVPNAPGTPGDPTGTQRIKEICVLVRSFSNQKIAINRVTGKEARIVHMRVRGLTTAEIALAQTQDESVTGAHRRVLYDNDCLSPYTGATRQYDTAASLRANAIDRYIGHDVPALVWCTGASLLVAYRSAVVDRAYGWPIANLHLAPGHPQAKEDMEELFNASTSPVEVLAQRGPQIGIEVWSNHRMNQFEPEDSKAYFLNGREWATDRTFKQYRQLAYRGDFPVGRPYLSYAHQVYRDTIRDLLVEQANLPNVSTVHLDFCRWPWLVGWPTSLMQTYMTQYGVDPRKETTVAGSQRWMKFRAAPVTDLMRSVRQATPGTQISVRIPHFSWLEGGMDLQTWINEGLIDILIPSVAHNNETFWPHLATFKNMIAGTNIQLYGGIQHFRYKSGRLPRQAADKVTPELYQARAYEFYQAGYDGIFVFNNWTDETNKTNNSDILGVLGDRVKNKKWRTFYYPGQWVDGYVTAAQP